MGYSHGLKWNDCLIKENILEVVKVLNLNRMPTRKEIELTMNNASLTNVISRTKGYYGWAKELGLNIKDSQTTLGKKYEYVVKDILENKGYIVEKMSQNYSFDLLINNNVKIDVKISNLYTSPDNEKWYSFNLHKKHANCDTYICICLKDEKIERMLIIPSSQVKITQLSIGKNSTYDKYNQKFSIIDEFITFYNKMNEVTA